MVNKEILLEHRSELRLGALPAIDFSRIRTHDSLFAKCVL